MRCRLHHADGRITAVDPDFHRYPLSTCPGAADPLQALVGEPIGQSARDFFGGGRARRNCTHMLDLAWLASRHATRGEGVRTYAIDIPDSLDEREDIHALCDGAEILRLHVEDGMILSPEPFAGRHLFRGFASWLSAQTELAEEVIEAAVIAQKVSMIIAARRYILPPGPLRERERREIAGACHGYAVETIGRVFRREGTVRDFSQADDRLLQFL